MNIESSRLIIEPITLEDGQMLIKNPMEYYYQHQVPYEVEWPHYSLKAMLPLYLENMESDRVPLGIGPWVIRDKHEGHIVGEVGFNEYNAEEKSVEIGYRILEKRQKRGYATEAVSSLCQWGFYQDINKITASCDKENIPSQRVLRKNGFKKIGQDRGIVLYEKWREVRKKKFQGMNSL
ncbi:GNAT family N-acetyltransferase [Sediminibacillus albus]|uniref:Protein N-acetyltransferase, RimJ/RimL family n=1 Tax=Sediminibacillus albus TaxID=407036 RepID=A0A1G8W998_9BACI|nr:GNAT family N-acetyltransferase [Sediminibacillus albus]SDJ74842.1 Protein N-acetyltransferase, RimJ/RimL family [Sediminibacillus albus]